MKITISTGIDLGRKYIEVPFSCELGIHDDGIEYDTFHVVEEISWNGKNYDEMENAIINYYLDYNYRDIEDQALEQAKEKYKI